MDLLQEPCTTKGDWIVHIFYGLGQVEGVDNKLVEGKNQSFLKVKTANSQYWIPIENIDFDRVRPLASKKQFKYALTLFRKPPEKLPKDHKLRRKEIIQAMRDISLYSDVRMIRDLYCRRASSKINANDNNTLIEMTNRFLNEWALVMGEDREELERKLNEALQVSMNEIKLEK